MTKQNPHKQTNKRDSDVDSTGKGASNAHDQ